MRKPLLTTRGVQVDEYDLDEANNPFKDTYPEESNRIQPKNFRNVRAGEKGRSKGFHFNLADHAHSSMQGAPQTANRLSHAHGHGHGHGYSHGHGPGGNELSEENHVLHMKVATLHLLHQLVGLDHKQVCSTLSRKLAGALRSDLCRVLNVDEPSKELEPYHDGQHEGEESISVDDSAAKSIAGETLRRKQYVHVQDLSTSTFFNPSVDLGPVLSRQAKWEHSNLVSLPIASHSGYLEMIIILARSSSLFTAVEIEAMSWMAVTLGNVLHYNKQLSTRESQVHLMDGIAEKAVVLAREGCEVQDPRFWMSGFDAQVAQIALVHQDQSTGRTLLYCNCSDTSKEEVSMTCFPLRYILVVQATEHSGRNVFYSRMI